MDKLLIIEKVKSIVANSLYVDLSEVTVDTEITETVKTEYKPIMDKPSFGNLWGRLTIASSSSSSDSFVAYLERKELIRELEEEFDITIPEEEADNIITVQQAVDCIFQKLTV